MSGQAVQSIAQAADLPTGGQIVAGTGSISQSGNTMTVVQGSANLVSNWQSFSIGPGHTVNFQQPSANAVALNRVLGSDVSVIQGALNANGKVFLVNPNGVTFTPSAQVNTGGLVASTLAIKTEDFMAGRYTFAGTSSNAVINQGNITAANGGTIALIAAKIINQGNITANGGNVLMGAGRKVTLDLGGPVKLHVDEGALDTLIEQGGAVRANGGTVYLTAKAAGTLATSVINHTGMTEAQTLSMGKKGEIILLGDMKTGTTKVAGKLDASAPADGDGGFIETSAAHVDMAPGAMITAGSAKGKGGQWLIDPYDYNIDATAAGNIAGALNTGTDVTVTTAIDDPGLGSGGNTNVNGDITVSSAIRKTAGGDAMLTLQAANNIILNAEITSTSNRLNLLLDADNDAGIRNGGGIIVANQGVSLNGGALDFGTGTIQNINGVNTMVGGDLYIGGNGQVVMNSGGGDINLNGELIIANNTGGVKFISGNGDINFAGTINSGNRYEKIVAGTGDYFTWDEAFADAQNGTAGGSALSDSYLATVTSRLENSLVVYAGQFPIPTGNNITDLSNGAWLGGARTNDAGVWYWLSGPEGEVNGGQGLAFSDSSLGGAPVNGQFTAWRSGEPNGGSGAGGEDRLQIGDAQGGWNDLAGDDVNVHLLNYIRETNLPTSSLEINAGTGNITFGGAIGNQRAINYVAYDASNPAPAPPPTVTSIPAQAAIATAQAGDRMWPKGCQKESISASDAYDAAIGSMDNVERISADRHDGDNTDCPSVPGWMDSQSERPGPAKVIVMDGGIRMPHETGAKTKKDKR